MQRRMSSISFKIQAFFVPQLQQPSFLSDAGSWLESCSSVTLSIYWLITSSRPVQKGRVKHQELHTGVSRISNGKAAAANACGCIAFDGKRSEYLRKCIHA